MSFLNALSSPPRWQWDPDSRAPATFPAFGNAPFNCGPSCVTKVAHFYHETWIGITETRRLAAPDFTPTNINQQKAMLEKRGVPCYMSQPSVPTMRLLVASAKRPIIVGLNMALVPAGLDGKSGVRGHPFTGSHSVVLQTATTVNGVRGFLVMDPNFSPLTGRKDPTNGRRFYPEWVIQAAFVGQGQWALIPSKIKVVKATLPFCSIVGGANLRTGPGGNFPLGVPRRNAPYPKVATSGVKHNEGSWTAQVNGKWVTGNDWRRVSVSGKWLYVIEPFTKLL